jgi:hypothetical protein
MAQSRISPPTSFNSSPLVRLLAGLDIANVADSTQTFAEKLSQWVAWTDAISLSSALDGRSAVRASVAKSGESSEANKVIEQFRQVCSELTQSIANDAMFAGEPVGKERPVAAAREVDFAIYRRHYVASQRVLDDRVGSLRARVRTAVALVSPALSRLAALDAAMEQALGAQQRRVLAKVPVLLEKCFKGLRKARLDASTAGDALDAATRHTADAAVGPTLQRVLQAELEMRLQPVQGMIDALGGNAIRQA